MISPLFFFRTSKEEEEEEEQLERQRRGVDHVHGQHGWAFSCRATCGEDVIITRADAKGSAPGTIEVEDAAPEEAPEDEEVEATTFL